MQQLMCKMVCLFLFFYSLNLKKRLDFKKKSWGRKVWNSVKTAETISPFSCCPLVVFSEENRKMAP